MALLKTEAVDRMKLKQTVVDHCGDHINATFPHIVKLLYKALGDRVRLVTPKPVADLVVKIKSFPCVFHEPTQYYIRFLADVSS